jgi:hypothetical protein
MNAKRPKPGSAALTEEVAPFQTGEDLDDVILAGPIGMEGQPSLEEWHELREAMFDELQKFPIPRNLIKAVRDFRPHAPVTWLNEKGEAAGPNDASVEPFVGEQPRSAPAELAQCLSDAKPKFDEVTRDSLPKTAGDALAKCLQYHLALVDRETQPVRSKGMLARSVIAGAAMDILENYALLDQPAGPELRTLIRALLKVNKRPLKSSREFSARYNAAWILAQRPSIGTRKLASILEVEPSSVSRWRKDETFIRFVESKKQSIQTLKDRKLWPPPLVGAAQMDNPEIAKRVRRLHKVRRVVSRWLSKHRDQIPKVGVVLIEKAIKEYDKILWIIGPRSI